jgi:hypothetical protein
MSLWPISCGERRGKSTAELEELREEDYDDIPF